MGSEMCIRDSIYLLEVASGCLPSLRLSSSLRRCSALSSQFLRKNSLPEVPIRTIVESLEPSYPSSILYSFSRSSSTSKWYILRSMTFFLHLSYVHILLHLSPTTNSCSITRVNNNSSMPQHQRQVVKPYLHYVLLYYSCTLLYCCSLENARLKPYVRRHPPS